LWSLLSPRLSCELLFREFYVNEVCDKKFHIILSGHRFSFKYRQAFPDVAGKVVMGRAMKSLNVVFVGASLCLD